MSQISQPKRIAALLLTLVILLVALPAAAAKDLVQSELLTFNVTRFYIDGESPSDPDLTIAQDASIDIGIRFFLSDGTAGNEAQEGDFFTFSLPSALTDIATFTATNTSLYDTDDETGLPVEIATLSISTTGQVSVVFTGSSITTLSNVTGDISFHGKFEKDRISGEGPVEFSLVAGGAVYRIGFEPDPAPVATSASLTKDGEYLPEERAIRWTIKATANTDVSNVTVMDTLDGKQTYVPDSSVGIDEPFYSSVDGPLTFTLGTLNADTEKSFTYLTKIKDTAYNPAEDQKTSLSNTAVLQIGAEPVATKSSIEEVTTDWIKKSGQHWTDAEGKHYIDWTIELNNNYRTAESVAVSDTLPSHLAMSPSSLLVNGEPSSFTTVNGNSFTYTFAGGMTGKNALKFTTKVDEAYYDQQDNVSFTNLASVTVDGNTYTASSGPVGVNTSLLSKSGQSYNPATQTITWRLNVNGNGRTITNAVITDIIPAKQEFIANSVTKDGSACLYTYDGAARLLTINLGNLTPSDRPVLTFQTKVTEAVDIATNKTTPYGNTAKLAGAEIATATSVGSINVASTVLAKQNTGYDYAARELSWKITVNQNNMVLPNVVVTDIIPDGQAYIPGSLQIGGAAPSGSVLSQNENTLTFTLGTLTAQTELTFKTRISDDAVFLNNKGNIKFSNQAALQSSYAAQAPVKSEKTVSNTALDKQIAVDYNKDNGYIEWLVNVNSNQAEMEDAYLGDALQDGLELDTESVRLYKWNQSANNTMTRGELVPSSAYSFTYEYQTRKFTLHLPDGPQGYQLLFRTDVKKPGMYSNTISLNGQATLPDSAQSESRVTQQSIDYSISGVNGSITVYKEDMSGNRLSGAVFERLDSLGNVLEVKTTDLTGKVVFDKLKLRTYYIREKTAPAGYALNAESIQVTLTDESAATRSKTVTIKNERMATPTPTPSATPTPVPTPTPAPTPNSGGGGGSIPRATPTPRPNTGSVEVVDKDPGSNVDIYDKDGKLVTTVKTDKDGKVTIPDLPYGEYTVRSQDGSREVEVIITKDNAQQKVALGPGVPKTGGNGKTLLALLVFLLLVGDVALAIRSVPEKRKGQR